MLKPVAFRAGRGEWGLFTSGPSSTPADPTFALRTIHVDGVGQSLVFARVTLTAATAHTSTGLVVVSAYPPFPADQITGGWDGTDPIVVEVDARGFEVSGEFRSEAWHLVVRHAESEGS